MAEALKYECVLFDWDGCLAATLDAWMAAFEEVNAVFGLETTKTEIARIFGIGKVPASTNGVVVESETYWGLLAEIADGHLSNVGLHDGALDLLVRLRAHGCRMGLVTSGGRRQIDDALARLALAHLFDVVVTWDDVENAKPHPEPIERALSAIGASASQTVMIGDSEKDIRAGRAAGVTTVLITHPESDEFHNREVLHGSEPDFVCNSFLEVATLLLH